MLLDRWTCRKCLFEGSVYYNEFNNRVQCHNCGKVYQDKDIMTNIPAVEEDVVAWCEVTQPEMCAEFKRIQREQYELMCRKQKDYGPLNISMGTQLSNFKEVKAALIGVIVRANDKMQRLVNLAIINQSDPQNEAIEDTFMDLANYSIIAMLVKNGKWGK